MSHHQAKQWEVFNEGQAKKHYPQWPNEAMVKLIFGDYLNNKIALKEQARILDIGCGFGNNLLPFLVRGYDCYGTEVTAPMAAQTALLLKERGFTADVREGSNRSLPFESDFFDLVLSINVIHYEGQLDFFQSALNEYKRVLKNNGHLVMLTVGPEHTIIQRAKREGPYRYRIQDYDFRDGTFFYCFEKLENLRQCVSETFSRVETGRVTEQLMKYTLDFFVAAGQCQK